MVQRWAKWYTFDVLFGTLSNFTWATLIQPQTENNIKYPPNSTEKSVINLCGSFVSGAFFVHSALPPRSGRARCLLPPQLASDTTLAEPLNRFACTRITRQSVCVCVCFAYHTIFILGAGRFCVRAAIFGEQHNARIGL